MQEWQIVRCPISDIFFCYVLWKQMKPTEHVKCIASMDIPVFSLSNLKRCSKFVLGIFDKEQLEDRSNWNAVIVGDHYMSDSFIRIERNLSLNKNLKRPGSDFEQYNRKQKRKIK